MKPRTFPTGRPPFPYLSLRAFTLLELLVVVAILLILAALLFPISRRMLQQSATATSLNNLRQIGLGFLAYAGENNSSLPSGLFYSSGGSEPERLWSNEIAPYLSMDSGWLPVNRVRKTHAVWRHPNDILGPSKDLVYRRTYAMVRTRRAGESLGAANSTGGPDGPREGRRLAAISHPSQTLLVTERPDERNLWYSANFCVIDSPRQQMNADDLLVAVGKPKLNNGRFNYLFVDGSVRTLAPEEMIGKEFGGTLDAPKGAWTVAGDD